MGCLVVFIGVVLLLLLLLLKNGKEGYGYFPPKYSNYMNEFYEKAYSGGYQQEFQDLCIKAHGERCALSSGVPGICVLNGMCASFEGNNGPAFPLRLPYSSRDCPIYCANHLGEKAGDEKLMEACVADCKLNYWPDGY